MRKGKRLSDFERVEIIKKARNNPSLSKRGIAREYGVDEKAVRKILQNEDDIMNRHSISAAETFRLRAAKYPDLEEKVMKWIEAARTLKIALPPSLIIKKALEIASEIGVSSDFKASWQWFSKFKARHGLNSILLHGEGGEVDRNDPKLLEALHRLESIISTFKPENIYNMDETGLFFCLLPRYSILLPSEDLTSVRGKKASKERVSLIVCANSTGSHKLPCTMIGKAKTPACIVGKKWPLPYFSQKNSWVDGETFNKWFNQVFVPAVRPQTSDPILLLLDNAPGHQTSFERNGISVRFFPPNCTSWKQPCDMGIIAALKKYYKYLILKEILDFHDLSIETKEKLSSLAKKERRGAAGVQFGKPPHLLDAANLIVEAWKSVTSTTIRNCFGKADIIPKFREDETCITSEHSEEDIAGLLRKIDNSSNNAEYYADQAKTFIIQDNDEELGYVECLIEEAENLQKSPEEKPDSETDAESEIEEFKKFEGFELLLENIFSLEKKCNEEFTKIVGVECSNQAKTCMNTLKKIFIHGHSEEKKQKIRKLKQPTLIDMWKKK